MRPKGIVAVACAVIFIIGAVAILPGYAHSYQGTTQSASQTVETHYIVLKLGADQYSHIETIPVNFHSEISITSSGRTVVFVSESSETLDVGGTPKDASKFVEFDVTVEPSGDPVDYQLVISKEDGTVDTDAYTYYVRYTDTTENVVSPASGTIPVTDFTNIVIPGDSGFLDFYSLKIEFFISANNPDDEPPPIFYDVTLKFTAKTEVES